MSKKLSRNAPCPCGSGKKYKHCCIDKDFDWMEDDDGLISRRVPISDEAAELLDSLLDHQRAVLGREPDLIFQGAPPFEHIEHLMVEAMKKSGVDPALIHAYEKTGLIVSDQNYRKIPDVDLREWDAAIEEFAGRTGSVADRRRLNETDLAAILKNGPRGKLKLDEAKQDLENDLHGAFVSQLPFPPPFKKEDWGSRQVSDLRKDPQFFTYLEKCIVEITRSGRGRIYLDMFLLMTHVGTEAGPESDYPRLLAEAREQHFTVEQFRGSLDRIAESFGPKKAAPNAAAAFEFLAFIDDFMRAYAKRFGHLESLKDSLQQINATALMAFVVAVNVELGVAEDIWKA
ncbi:MAG: SEC-C domain-containing protein [Planctomycetales bacterium]|nr:SEC-C domain-containing protein [Planctomycetales bacterium]